MIYKLIAGLFLVLTPIFAHILVKIFGLKQFKLFFPDLAFPLYILETVLISKQILNYNLLPHLVILLALLSLTIICLLVIRKQKFSYKRFIKLFWRIGFIIAFFFYLILVFYIFIH